MQQRSRIRRASRRGGFTLIELMISVTLALMIMVMFSQVYQMAAATVTTQKGIRRNDERARMLSTVIRADLNNRTFVDVIPFWPGQNTLINTGPRYVQANRRGYFSISENDPNNNTDDVLAFTVIIPNDGSQMPYIGRARQLGNILADPNQPDFDDGDPNANQTGASRAAEIVYFLRNGNLYRRLLLIRDSYTDVANPQPTSLTGPYADNFWEDFAYSALYRAAAPPKNGPQFHGIEDSLLNLSTSKIDSITNWPTSLGVPHLRFGHSVAGGILPREYIESGEKFIGRFTTRETADQNFLYPGRLLLPIPMGQASGDPHVRNDLTDSNNDGIVDQYKDSTTRRGEDLLMANVHKFDIKVWDDSLSKFVDLGHGGGGRYGTNLRDPTNNRWNRYDTWHPFKQPAGVGLGQRPFPVVPANYNGPDGKPGVAGFDDDGLNGIDDPGERGWIGTDDEVRLRAIQITIQFYDVATEKMRQVTIIQSLSK